MGGKGQRRREKNYRSAHGGESRLPPPPKLEELEAVPFKLRKLMELKNPSSSSAKKGPVAGKESKKGRATGEKEENPSRQNSQSSLSINRMTGDSVPNATIHKEKIHEESVNERESRKKKRKRKEVNDLRFQHLDQAVPLSRKKKRKEYLDAKKKKHKKAKTEDFLDFPGREIVKFGDVVQAPPKLSVPKALKNVYQERVRSDAIEAYRKHKGWTSRLGVEIPMPEQPS